MTTTTTTTTTTTAAHDPRVRGALDAFLCEAEVEVEAMTDPRPLAT
jgi:hypothetical protein